MPVQVRVNGRLLSLYGTVSGVVDSTEARDNDWSGDTNASCTFVPFSGTAAYPAGFDWLQTGATYEHVEGGRTTWGGYLSIPAPNDDGTYSLKSTGWGDLLDEWLAFEAGVASSPGAQPIRESVDPNAAVDYAIANLGLPLIRGGNLNHGTIGAADPSTPTRTLKDLLLISAANGGMRLYVDSFGVITMRPDPVPGIDAPTWIAHPGSAYLGTTDSQYVTDLYAKFLDSASGGGVGWLLATNTATDGVALADKIGQRRPAEVDLTGLGPVTSSEALGNLDGRFEKIGARVLWTNPVALTPTNTIRSGWGTTSPLGMHGAEGAGAMLRIPDIADNRSTATFLDIVDLVMGGVTRSHDDSTVTATPLAPVARDITSLLAAAIAVATDAASDAVLTT